MKRFIILTTIAFSIGAGALKTIDESGSGICSGAGPVDFPPDELFLEEEIVTVESVFAPKGFDAGDRLEIIASVWTPTPNYTDPKGYVERVGNDIKITVKAKRRTSRNHLNIDMAMHHLISIPVPAVPAGDYNVYVNTETASPQFAKMEIAPPMNASIDDFLYPVVKYVEVNAKTRDVELVVENPNSCYVLDRIISTSNGVNTYALMPIMRKKEGFCTQALTTVKYFYKLPHDLHASRLLVHVRTLDGNSKNEMFEPKD
jgi:hypothetical protein